MYMSSRKNRKSGYYNYNTDSFPANYSGQYTAVNFPARNRPDSLREDYERDIYEKEEVIEGKIAPPRHEDGEREHPREAEKEHKGSILDSLGGIFKRRDDGGGFLKNLFSGKNMKNIFTDLDFEDLILLGVIFFLLRDGAEDDLLIILAILLFTGG